VAVVQRHGVDGSRQRHLDRDGPPPAERRRACRPPATDGQARTASISFALSTAASRTLSAPATAAPWRYVLTDRGQASARGALIPGDAEADVGRVDTSGPFDDARQAWRAERPVEPRASRRWSPSVRTGRTGQRPGLGGEERRVDLHRRPIANRRNGRRIRRQVSPASRLAALAARPRARPRLPPK
jgi:hypothetical protein